MIKKWIGSFALWVTGWKIELQGDKENLNRCVLVVAPHTTNWEFVLGILAYWKLEKPIKLIIKDAHTKAWYGWIVRKLGGIGIDSPFFIFSVKRAMRVAYLPVRI